MIEELKRRIETVVQSFGLEIYDIEVEEKGRMIRVYIDGPGGVTIDDCSEIASLINPIVAHEAYRLEVSSPGVERKLRGPEDFQKSLGRMVRVKDRQGVKIGRLVRVNGEGFEIEVGSQRIGYRFDAVKRVNLFVPSDELFGRSGAGDH